MVNIRRLLARQGQAPRALVLAAAGLLAAGQGWAHAHLESAQPPVDSTVGQAPQRVQIHFTEKLEPKLASLSVKNAAGQRVDDGKPQVAATDARQLSVALTPALPPGTYAVDWAITSVDTHRTTGQYKFTVKP